VRKRLIRRCGSILLICIAGSAAAQATQPTAIDAFSSLQARLIFPGMITQGAAVAHYEVPRGAERVELRAPGGERIEALFCPASRGNSTSRPTIIYFYGNGQCLAQALSEVAFMRDCGANVLAADYLGYGLSEGKPSETGCYATALALHEHASQRRDIDPAKLIACGWSLGAAVAIDLAQKKQTAGLITLSAFTSMRDVARQQFPYATPDLLEHPFLNLEKIRDIRCPTLLIHGREDTLVPFSMSAELRAASAGRPVNYLAIARAGHNDLFAVGRAPIKRAISRLVDQVSRETSSTRAPKTPATSP